MNRKVWVLLVALALPVGGAGDAPLDRATLRGIKAISVVIDPVASEIQDQGATADGLRDRLQERLRDAGLNVDPASREFVGLRLMSVRAGRGPFAIVASLALYQQVTLVRDKNLKTATQTWGVDTVVLADLKQVKRACLDSVDELAARFVTAYQSENPKGVEREK
jgi:hypothetical protein